MPPDESREALPDQITTAPKLLRGSFELHFANGVAVVAHPYGLVRSDWFSRLYVDHKCVAGGDGETLADALLSLNDEIEDETGLCMREWLGRPSDEQGQTQSCGRLLVGQGSDTYDPLCVLPAGHAGVCKPEEDHAA